MAYSFEQIFAADPANPSNIAQNASVTIFAPGDATMTPIAITDPDGTPLPNPIPVNANGFGSAFMADLDRVAWIGGGFTGFFTSYEGMKQVALDAQTAAESAAATAGTEAAAVAEAAIAGATDEATAAAASAATAASNASASATAAANAAALVGAPADSAIAAAVNGSGTATKAALNATYARVIGVPSGSTAAQINTAIAGAGPNDIVRLYGTYTTTDPIVVTSHLEAAGATINYSGTGVAMQVGAGGAGVRIDYKTVVLPTINNTLKTANGWAQVAGSVGIRIVNANTCTITAQKVRNFETNLEIRGEGAGCAYNTVILGHLSNAKYGQRFTADGSGWVNQNTFVGGRIDMDSVEGDRVTGTRFVLMENTFNAVNGNIWTGTAVEGNGAEYTIETYGQYNSWIGCRFEASMGARVWWRAAATRNAIMQGYGAPVPTIEAGAIRNEISQAGSRRDVTVSSTAGAYNFQNDSSGAAPAWTVMDPNTSLYTNDPATKYVLAATALLLKGKRAADSFDRIQFDMNNARLAFGDGTAAPTTYFGWDSAGLLKITGASLYPATHNANDLGINANRWRYGRFGTGVVVGAFATASRPAAATGGVGTMVFDTTLNKPIWSDGTNWRDATGTVV